MSAPSSSSASDSPSRRRRLLLLAAATILALTVLVAGLTVMLTGREEPPVADPEPHPTAGELRAYPTFGPDNAFDLDVSQAPVDPRSEEMIAHLRGQIDPNYSGIAALNVYDYTASLHVVDSSTPREDIEFYDCQDKGYTPEGLYDGPAQFADVPIPPDAKPAPGTDKAMSIWSPETDQLWEFWVMERTDDGWRACWGGRIDDVSSNPGYFEHPFGATATGIPMVGTMLRVQDVASGSIDHALGVALLSPAEASRWRYPANRSDGGDTSPDAIPEGARLRLDPDLDLDTLDLTPVGRMIAEAAQTYGFIVVDRAGAVAVIGESGIPEKNQLGVNPWETLIPGEPYRQMRNFPWDRVEVLRADVGVPEGADVGDAEMVDD